MLSSIIGETCGTTSLLITSIGSTDAPAIGSSIKDQEVMSSQSQVDRVVAMPPPSAPYDDPGERVDGGTMSSSGCDGQTASALSDAAVAVLRQQGYTSGLVQALLENKRVVHKAFWIIDNSGSMATLDGHRLVATKGKNQVRLAACTRWKELQETVEYHAQLSALLQRPTQFRLLNDPGRNVGPKQFSVAEVADEACIQQDLEVVHCTMQQTMPSGVTPLTHHLQQVYSHVHSLQEGLRCTGTRVVLVVCTDGIPTDQEGYTGPEIRQQFVSALRRFQGLPVWIVVRLCTDEDAVVQFWGDLDNELELSLEVLDDFLSEAAEVHQHNPWLNYALPLHRMREMGFHSKLFDLLDERRLVLDEVRDFCRILFGEAAMDLPDPDLDFKDFVAKLNHINSNNGREQWNPVTKRMESWVDIRMLKRLYGGSWFSLW